MFLFVYVWKPYLGSRAAFIPSSVFGPEDEVGQQESISSFFLQGMRSCDTWDSLMRPLSAVWGKSSTAKALCVDLGLDWERQEDFSEEEA